MHIFLKFTLIGPLLTITTSCLAQTHATTEAIRLEERNVRVFKVPNDKIDTANARKAEELAKSFIIALALNKENLLEMAGFPFAFDKRAIFENKKQMKEELLSTKNDKRLSDDEKAQLILNLSAKTIKRQCEIIDYLIPIDVYIVHVKIKDKDNREHGAGLAIKMYPVPSVVAFSD